MASVGNNSQYNPSYLANQSYRASVPIARSYTQTLPLVGQQHQVAPTSVVMSIPLQSQTGGFIAVSSSTGAAPFVCAQGSLVSRSYEAVQSSIQPLVSPPVVPHNTGTVDQFSTLNPGASQFVPQPLPQGGVDGRLPLSQTHGPERSANAGWCTPDLSSQAGVHADIDHGNEVVRGQSSLGTDMWRQLKRVSLPIFSGDKRQLESWHAAFKACVDQAPATAEYKLLQLRQYLSGEALQASDNLGHSPAA